MQQQTPLFPGRSFDKAHKAKPYSGLLRPTVILRFLCAVMIITGLSACSGDETGDLQQYVQETKAKQKGSIPPLPKPKTFETFVYDDTLLRDPFLPTAIKNVSQRRDGEGQGQLQPDSSREKDVLEQFALGSLKMVGSLERDGRRWALIKASDGTIHRTTTGRHIGQDNGKILRITETQIELREIVPDGLGGWIERRSALTVSE